MTYDRHATDDAVSPIHNSTDVFNIRSFTLERHRGMSESWANTPDTPRLTRQRLVVKKTALKSLQCDRGFSGGVH